MTRSHFYNFFYLYSYAICISVASNVAKEILAGNKEMLDNYIKFLSTGSDVDTMETFKILGVDLESKDVYENAIKYFDELIDKFNKIYEEA
jgi:oligoendopeptidase F